MTVLGEFVLPRDTPVWTATLLDVLGMFGTEEKSARQALARSSAEGWLTATRAGRRVRWSLTPPGKQLLSEGAQRIYEFGANRGGWDGRWLLLLVSVPESQRDLRHRVRTRLSWAGFGSPSSGVWVSPDVDRQPEARKIISELSLTSAAMSFIASYGEIGDEESMVARSWDLRALEERYENFIAEFAAAAPTGGADALRTQTRLVHEWRRFPFLDPQLPLGLLPTNWSGLTAATLFHERHAVWREPSQAYWDELVTREPSA